MKALGVISLILLIIGGLNWGLVGVFEFNLVEKVFTQGWLVRLVYVLVGLAALYKIFFWRSCCSSSDQQQ